jgi:hypothetical protein
MLVLDVAAWARSIAADRVDLSATPPGQRIYEKLGFTLTPAPRMKPELAHLVRKSVDAEASDVACARLCPGWHLMRSR